MPAREMERMMKLQEVILKAMAKKISSFNANCSGNRLHSIAVRNKKPPGLCRGAHAQTAGFSLPADLDGGSATRGAGADVTVGDNLDPEGILALVIRGGAGITQRIQAVLRRTRGGGSESRQL